MGLFLDEDIDLLADVGGVGGGWGEAEDDGEDAGIDAFAAGACEVLFGDDEGFDADEGERDGVAGVAFAEGDGFGSLSDARGDLFIDIGADLERGG